MYTGLIRIECPLEADSAGNFVANAFHVGSASLVATATHATRLTAIANCYSGLATTIEGDLSKNPVTVVPPNVLQNV